MRKFQASTVAVALMALMASKAFAVQIGEPQVLSKQGAMLLAEIPVKLDAGENQVNARIASKSAYAGLGVSYGPIMRSSSTRVVDRAGRQVIQIVSAKPIVDVTALRYVLEVVTDRGVNTKPVTLTIPEVSISTTSAAGNDDLAKNAITPQNDNNENIETLKRLQSVERNIAELKAMSAMPWYQKTSAVEWTGLAGFLISMFILGGVVVARLQRRRSVPMLERIEGATLKDEALTDIIPMKPTKKTASTARKPKTTGNGALKAKTAARPRKPKTLEGDATTQPKTVSRTRKPKSAVSHVKQEALAEKARLPASQTTPAPQNTGAV